MVLARVQVCERGQEPAVQHEVRLRSLAGNFLREISPHRLQRPQSYLGHGAQIHLQIRSQQKIRRLVRREALTRWPDWQSGASPGFADPVHVQTADVAPGLIAPARSFCDTPASYFARKYR